MRGLRLNDRCAVNGMKCACRSLGRADAPGAVFADEDIFHVSFSDLSHLHSNFRESILAFTPHIKRAKAMTKPDGHDDPKIAKFPDERERKALERAHIVHHTATKSEPVLNLPPIVQALCFINAGVFLFGKLFPQVMTGDVLYTLSFIPARYFGAEPMGLAGILSPFTHMFVHAGWLHVLVNVGMLMAFGAGLEKIIGGRRLLLFYFATGLFGAMVHALLYPSLEVPMIGASGAVSGLFGGVLMMMYMGGSMGQGYRKLLPFVLVWIGITVLFGLFGMPGVDNPIAWTTHIGGFIGGLLLYKPVRRLKIQH